MTIFIGYYDRAKATWIALGNGRVVKIISLTGGAANLDTDGDSAIDDGQKNSQGDYAATCAYL